jgi:hypothetical protein
MSKKKPFDLPYCTL